MQTCDVRTCQAYASQGATRHEYSIVPEQDNA
jgi:hypothetical protein